MREFHQVVTAGRVAQASGSTSAFNKARTRYLARTGAVERKLERGETAVRAATGPIVKAFAAYATQDKEAKNIVARWTSGIRMAYWPERSRNHEV